MSVEKKQKEIAGIAHIYASHNNTFVHITDLAGYTIARVTGGMVTKHDRLKANPTVAMFVAKRAAEKAKELGINALYVRISGEGTKLHPTPGPGARSAVKALAKEGLKILSVIDVTPVPRGGPKPPGGRRGRRV